MKEFLPFVTRESMMSFLNSSIENKALYLNNNLVSVLVVSLSEVRHKYSQLEINRKCSLVVPLIVSHQCLVW